MTILVECVLWGTYGVARQDPALTTLGVIGSGAALAIVVRVLWTRDRFVDQGAQLHGRVEIEAAIPLGAGSLAVAGVCRDHRQEAAWVGILRVDLDRPGQLVPCRPQRCPAKLGAGAGRRVEQQEPGVGERLGVIRPLLQDLRVQILGAPGRRRSAPVPGALPRSAGVWSGSAVRAILVNPRYLGHRVVGRQRRRDELVEPTNPAAGTASKQRRTRNEGLAVPGPRSRSAPRSSRRASDPGSSVAAMWWRGQDLNLRPSGYEPDELPDCSTPRRSGCSWYGPGRRRATRTRPLSVCVRRMRGLGALG